MTLSVGRIVVAAADMGIAVYLTHVVLAGLMAGRSDVLAQLFLVAAPAGVGMLVYGAVMHVLGSREVSELLRAFRPKTPPRQG
jgi:hypothetical protein